MTAFNALNKMLRKNIFSSIDRYNIGCSKRWKQIFIGAPIVQMSVLLNIIKGSDRGKSKIRIFCGIKTKQQQQQKHWS